MYNENGHAQCQVESSLMSFLDILQDSSDSRGPVHRITHSSSDFDGRLSRAIPFIGRERGKRGWRGREITSRRRSNLYPLSLSVDRVFYCAGKQIVAREIISFNRVPRRRM